MLCKFCMVMLVFYCSGSKFYGSKFSSGEGNGSTGPLELDIKDVNFSTSKVMKLSS